MPDLSRLTRIQMLASIRDYPSGDLQEALERHGLDEAPDVMVVERGKQYDARVLLVTTYERVAGEQLTAADLPDDLAAVFSGLEFKVVSRREQLAAETAKTTSRRAPAAPRASRARAAVPAKPERPAPPVCPQCFMQMPAGSGVCENCG